MDGYELNKIFGAITGVGAVLLTISLGVGGMFAPAHHDEEHAKLGFHMEIEEAGGGAEKVVEEVTPLPVLLQQASLEKGEKLFKKCQSCHQIGDGAKHRTGPLLTGIVGRPIGKADGFTKYSDTLANFGGDWTFAALDGFLHKPKEYAAGTSMNFSGFKKPEDRAAIIAWLNTQSSSPLPLPSVE